MEYKILQIIVNNMIDKFLSEYKISKKLFENTDVKNNLLHAGEYGIYKEHLCKELFGYLLPSKYAIGSGFIYNSEKRLTKQCDIIIFDYLNTPNLSFVEKDRFFPHESVMAIGQIKSTLNKNSLSEAIITLAKNKSIRKGFNGINTNGCLIDVLPSLNAYHHLFSFVLCDKIDGFDSIETIDYIEKEYENSKIPIEDRHNVIVSLQDGLITYKLDFPHF